MERLTARALNRNSILILSGLLAPGVLCLGCDDPSYLTADMPLHLEDHIAVASITGSELPTNLPQPVEWRFDEPQPDWKPAEPVDQRWEPVRPVRVDDALRLPLTEEHRVLRRRLLGEIYVPLPDWNLDDWGFVEIRARSRDRVEEIGLDLNHTKADSAPDNVMPFYSEGREANLITDGTVQTYRIPVGRGQLDRQEWEGPWTDLGIWFTSRAGADEVALDLLSVRVIPRGDDYREDAVSVHSPELSGIVRRAIVTYAPSRLEWRIRVPQEGRLALAAGLADSRKEVRFRVTVTVGGDETVVFADSTADASAWRPASADLSEYAGQTIDLALETASESEGAIAFWGAPTLSSLPPPDKPNVIFYVIDGAGADWMSVYGYNRRTTPFLERLAQDAVVFEQAYSNATSTQVSAPSYMTGLLFSAMLPLRSPYELIPDGVTTMTEHFAQGRWQTGIFSWNPRVTSSRNLDRNVDLSNRIPTARAVSSEHLHHEFWNWRNTWGGQPFWAQFQTLDVHEPFETVPPFSGLYLSPEDRERYYQLDEVISYGDTTSYAPAGTTVEEFALAQQALYDEGMAHQDHHLERFVARLKAEGLYENTILVIASDHGFGAASHRIMPGMDWGAPYIHPFATHVPLMFVWPGHIAGGRRIRTPVSMLDVLPTLLDLVSLPQPELRQGQSLAPLLLGQVAEEDWESQPVIVDVLVEDGVSGELMGNFEMIDGRWGAALCLRPPGLTTARSRYGVGDGMLPCVPAGRPEGLLLYDLWDDPLLQRPINAERPDLVQKYTALLEAQMEANAAIREALGASGERTALTPEQLEMLRTLGYIR